MLTALVASLIAPPLVSYETLAKPLPDILADIAPMVGKQIVCDKELSQDRLCIYVRDVEPRELLGKVIEAVAGTINEEGNRITVLQDHEFDKKLLERRNASMQALHADWRSHLEKPVKIGPDQVDLHEIADLVTPEVLQKVSLVGNLRLARPNEANALPIPGSVPNFYERFSSPGWKGLPYSGMRVDLTSTRRHVELTLSFLLDKNPPGSVYTYYFSPYQDKPDSFAAKWVQPTGAVVRRLEFFKYKFSEDDAGWTLSTKDFDAFTNRPWNDEPLNAVTAHVLVNGAKTLNRNLVAYLDDRAVARVLPQFMFALFLFDDFRIDDGNWVVGQVIDPIESRECRFNRTHLTDFVRRSQTRGYFDFWDIAQYIATPGAANGETLKLEAAGLGPVAYFACPTSLSPELAACLSAARRNTSLWNQLTSEGGATARSLPQPTRDHIVQYFRTGVKWLNGFPRPGGDTNQKLSGAEAGLDKALPQNASVRVVSKDIDSLIAVNRQREYLTLTNPIALGYSVALVKAGKGEAYNDAVATIEEFVPCTSREIWFEVEVNGFVFNGPGFSYVDLVDGVDTRPLDKLPERYLDSYNKSLAEARKKLGGG